MRVTTTFRTACQALLRNKLRSMLTALGIIIGVGAVIAITSLGSGARAAVEAQIAALGDNVILVLSGSNSRGGVASGFGGAGTLTIDDAEAIEREIADLAAVSPGVRRNQRIIAGSQNWFTSVQGEGPAFFTIRRWPLLYGEVFTERDVIAAAKVCVVGTTVARQIFGSPEAALGQTLRVRNVPFTVVGVLASKGNNFAGQDQDDVVVMPYTSAMKRVTGDKRLRIITVSTTSTELLSVAQQQIAALLRERHGIRPGMDDDFTVRSQEDIAQTATATSRELTYLLGAIAGVSLVVGGIGIMNIMLVSVTERTREIGLRLAVGARSGEVLWQFLVEAIVISLLGGFIGVVCGIGVAQILRANSESPTLIEPLWVGVSFAFSGLIGVVFGYYPARRAASLDPIDALRHE
ncbi:MAG: ABC transporter permease [Verrucomicrobia bacterium]|nr:ABC transporter permease [Verrucomicrobiota bacterium]